MPSHPSAASCWATAHRRRRMRAPWHHRRQLRGRCTPPTSRIMLSACCSTCSGRCRRRAVRPARVLASAGRLSSRIQGIDTTNISEDWHGGCSISRTTTSKFLRSRWTTRSILNCCRIYVRRRGEANPDAPVLDMHDVDVVYILTKPMYIDDMSRVHDVSVSMKTIQWIADFSVESVGFMFTHKWYLQTEGYLSF